MFSKVDEIKPNAFFYCIFKKFNMEFLNWPIVIVQFGIYNILLRSLKFRLGVFWVTFSLSWAGESLFNLSVRSPRDGVLLKIFVLLPSLVDIWKGIWSQNSVIFVFMK